MPMLVPTEQIQAEPPLELTTILMHLLAEAIAGMEVMQAIHIIEKTPARMVEAHQIPILQTIILVQVETAVIKVVVVHLQVTVILVDIIIAALQLEVVQVAHQITIQVVAVVSQEVHLLRRIIIQEVRHLHLHQVLLLGAGAVVRLQVVAVLLQEVHPVVAVVEAAVGQDN
jgi:hypothetical protein